MVPNKSFHLTKPLGTPLAVAKAAPNVFAGEPNVKQNRQIVTKFSAWCISVFLVLSTSVNAQTILLAELNEFRCGLQVTSRSGQFIVTSPSMEYWKVGDPAESADSAGFVDRQNRIKEFSYIESLSSLREDSSSGLLVIPLQPLGANQFQDHVLSFWVSMGDSLRLVSVAGKGRTASPGKFRLSEIRRNFTNRAVFFTASENIDAGDVWGAVDVYVFDSSSQKSELAHSERFSWEWCALSDTLSATWSHGEQPEIRFIRRIVEGEPDQGVEEGCRSVTVSADTSFWKPEVEKATK